MSQQSSPMVPWGVREALTDHELTASEREEAYAEALEAWRARRPQEVERWLEVEWMTVAVFEAGAAKFLAAKYYTFPYENLRNALIFRRAIIYTLEAVEAYRGEPTYKLLEGGQQLLAMQFMDAGAAPPDLAERVALAVERLRGMEDEDLAVLYRAGAHWLINEFRTPEEMVEPLRAVGTELCFFPVMRPLNQNWAAGSTSTDPQDLLRTA